MSVRPCFLIVDAKGVVLAANTDSRAALGEIVGHTCADVIAARTREGHAVCGGCGLLEGTSDDHVDVEAWVHGQRVRLSCSRVSDQVVIGMRSLPNEIVAAPLSPRERDVLALVADGRTSSIIGRRVGITDGTARSYVRRILDKLGARTRAHAVAMALRNGQLE
jgi:DNA-binding CsgD family transcriptional regulator